MVYNKHEWQDGELITSVNLNHIEDGVDNSQTWVSVSAYGAVGNGISDDTNAFKEAISIGKSIFVPSGTYLITASLDLNEVTVIGENEANTILRFGNETKYGVGINNQASISGLTLDTTLTTTYFPAIRLGSIYIDGDNAERTRDATFSRIDNITINCLEGNTNVTGILAESFGITDGNQHVWDVSVNNIFMKFPNDGLVLDTHSYGWLNSNNFSNINIRGLNHFGIWLNSSDTNPRGIQHNSFNNIQVEFRSSTPDTARALMIQAGEYNLFNNFSSFNDSGQFRYSIEYNTSIGYPNEKSIHENNILSGTVEGQLAPFVGSLQKLNKINLTVVDDWSTKLKNQSELFRTNYKTINTNILGGGILDAYYDDISQVPLALQKPSTLSEVVDVDDAGAFSSLTLNVSDTLRYFYSVFGKNKEKMISTGKATVSVLFKYSGDISDLSIVPYLNMFTGTSGTVIQPENINFEKHGNGFYTVTSNINVSSFSNVAFDFINITISLSGSGTFKLYGIKSANNYVQNYNDITDEREISNKIIQTSVSPTKFSDIGVYMPPVKTTVFDTNLAIIKGSGSNFKTIYPVKF